MKVKTQKYTFKAFALLFALLFTVLFIPVNEMAAWAKIAEEYTDYSYMTIGSEDEKVTTSVYTGATYTIANAYIGGKSSFKIGDESLTTGDAQLSAGVKLVRSDVTVTYGSSVGSEHGKVEVTKSEDGSSYGTFVAEREGAYTVTYSYAYEIDGKTYYNYYDMTVASYVSEVNINLEANQEDFFPSIIDLSLLKADKLNLPVPTVTDEDGEEIENLEIIIDDGDLADKSEVGAEDDINQLLVTVTGGPKGSTINKTEYLTMEEGKVVLSTAVFTADGFDTEFADYEITYSFYHNGQFVTSLPKEKTTVYKKYYENYSQANLTIKTDASMPTSVQPGVEQELPGVIVTTNSKVTPENSTVDVYYTLKVQYRAKAGDKPADLDKALYNTDAENPVIDEKGNLVDPTKFTPLQEGYYNFIYTATDIYDNPVSTSTFEYKWDNVKDTEKPSAIVYDASVVDKDGKATLEDASSKLKLNAYPNGVVIYAVGIKDNLATIETADLKREVLSSSSTNDEPLFVIEGYDAYNLVFNYKASSNETNNAYENFLDNNYLVRKDIANKELSVKNDAEMLSYFKDNHYLIVIDRGNAGEIQRYFADVFTAQSAEITDGESLIAWASEQTEKTLSSLGFAFIDTKETFGASSNNGGFNYSTYSIRYCAVDTADNENYHSYSITLTTSSDNEAPELSISTTFEDVYQPTEKVTFAKPTVSDNEDTSARMIVKTFYRLLDDEGDVVEVKDGEEVISNVDMDDIFDDLTTQQDNINDSTGITYAEMYKKYHFSTENTNDGYVDITDSEASEYTIDLAKSNGATRVQIFAYAYDDAGNVGVVGKEFDVANEIDKAVPKLKSVEVEDEKVYYTNVNIETPTVTVVDDLVSYMEYNIVASHIDEEGNRTSTETVFNATKSSSESEGEFIVNGGTFSPSFAGDYTISTALTDRANNTIVVFTHYEVNETINSNNFNVTYAFDGAEVELDEYYNAETGKFKGVNIPTPEVEIFIDNTVDYETYKENADSYTEKKPDYVVIGVDADGRATDYSVSNGLKNTFVPKTSDVGKQIEVTYTVNLRAYNPSYFSYNEGTKTDLDEFNKNYFTMASGDTTTKFKTIDENTLKLKFTDNNVYIAEKDSEGNITAYLSTDESKNNVAGSTLSSLDFNEIFGNLITVVSNSAEENGVKYIKVSDKTGPVIEESYYNYERTIDAKELKGEGYTLKIKGISASDASGINFNKSSITVKIERKEDGDTITDTTIYSDGDAELYNGTEKVIKDNCTITITYTVFDNNNNSTSSEGYVIKAGDVTAPEVKLDGISEEDFTKVPALTKLEDNLLKIDISKIKVTDDNTTPENITVEYELTLEGSTETIEAEYQTDDEIAYKVTEAGVYTFKVIASDEAGNFNDSVTFDFDFTVEDTSPTNVNQIIGTVLIVISVLVLAGVIIYFVVSKVKLDKELKK